MFRSHRAAGRESRLLAISMLLRCCAACPPSGSPRRATAHRSVRFVGILVPAFCPPYDSARADHALALENPAKSRGIAASSSVDLESRLHVGVLAFKLYPRDKRHRLQQRAEVRREVFV